MNSNEIKYLGVRLLFAGELMVLLWVYMCGVDGFMRLLSIRNECNDVKQALSTKQQEVKSLTSYIAHWHDGSFYKEKMAREDLNMARPDELIYHIS